MHIRHRFAAAVTAMALAFAGAAAASTANAQTSFQVEQGRELLLGTVDYGGDATVDPPQAGALRFIESAPGDPTGVLYFTASASYIGSALIRGIDGSLDPVTIAIVNVVGPRADVGATFTPRPAPGPCIQILSGGTVDFGDVTVGVAKTAATETVVSNCSSGLDVDIFGSVSRATSGSGPSAVVLEPVVSPAGPNQFIYRLFGIESTSALLDSVSSVRVRGLPNGFTRSLSHELRIGAGSSTGLNSQFSATVNLLATVA